MYILDTNILIYYSNHDEDIVNFIKHHQNSIYHISVISITEFLSFPDLTSADEKFFYTFVDKLAIISINREVSLLAASLKRNYHLKLGDGLIAATTLVANKTLITRNTADFRKIPDLQLLAI